MGKKGKNTKSATAPISRLESKGARKKGGKTKVKEEKSFFGQAFFTLFLFCKKNLLQAKAFTENSLRRKPVLKEKGIEIGRRGSFNKLFLLKKIG